jgi:hypothetical protein
MSEGETVGSQMRRCELENIFRKEKGRMKVGRRNGFGFKFENLKNRIHLLLGRFDLGLLELK